MNLTVLVSRGIVVPPEVTSTTRSCTDAGTYTNVSSLFKFLHSWLMHGFFKPLMPLRYSKRQPDGVRDSLFLDRYGEVKGRLEASLALDNSGHFWRDWKKKLRCPNDPISYFLPPPKKKMEKRTMSWPVPVVDQSGVDRNHPTTLESRRSCLEVGCHERNFPTDCPHSYFSNVYRVPSLRLEWGVWSDRV